ncbi:MAG: DinB family protein [Mycobacteriales bacterium]
MADRAGAAEPAGERVHCAECGFDSADLPLDRFRVVLDGHVQDLARALGSVPDAALRHRPDPATWSALEYAGHVADVLELFERRTAAIRSAPLPDLEVLDHDRVVRERGHNDAAVAVTVGRLRRAAAALSETAERLRPGDLDRAGHRAGQRRTIREVLHRAVHEAAHHARDARRLLAAADRPGRR